MNFENAVAALRNGAKIWHPTFQDDEYLLGCYIGLNTEILGIPSETFEEAKARGISIVKMKGDNQHPDMLPRNWPNRQPCCNPDLHSMPQLNLLLVMSEDWEILDGIK
jgi:hypothetical protein